MTTEVINLNIDNPTTAYIARPDSASAAIVLIHEWWGINDHIRDIAERYANEGYLCVAPDLYRGRVAQDPTEAAELMNSLPLDDGVATIRAAIEAIKTAYSVTTFGITGYCMGGTFSLRAACELSEIGAAAPFYGDIPEEPVLAKLKAPTLFIAGLRDAWINPEKTSQLEAVAQKHELPVEVVSYDADHAFFNDTRPAVYDAEAARDAWRRVLDHFRKHLLKSGTQGA
ncbi:MAG TPA: dienelactone hydrolase family protein [Pyrinomonadaceae bacterium]|nr:dienelactone hydrolase family protein [Pyrinomonadaceae bacterium]